MKIQVLNLKKPKPQVLIGYLTKKKKEKEKEKEKEMWGWLSPPFGLLGGKVLGWSNHPHPKPPWGWLG
jgi:hypothetical protein